MIILNKCEYLVSIAIITLVLSTSIIYFDTVFAQSNNQTETTDNRTSINLTAVVINSTGSIKSDIMDINQMIQTGNVSGIMEKISHMNDTVITLEECATTPRHGNYDFQ